eukprot:scaffold268610_cov24-Attheya_sp.AAC.1
MESTTTYHSSDAMVRHPIFLPSYSLYSGKRFTSCNMISLFPLQPNKLDISLVFLTTSETTFVSRSLLQTPA